MEELLGELRGHLVVYPTRFLEAEDLANNFLFNVSHNPFELTPGGQDPPATDLQLV